MFRCANDYFGYCTGTPEWDVEPNPTSLGGGHCRLNPETCSKYDTFLQSVRRQTDETKDKLDDWSEFNCVKKLVVTLEREEGKG